MIIIVRNYVTDGLNVEEVGGRRESQSPKAHSIGQRPMYKSISVFALKVTMFAFANGEYDMVGGHSRGLRAPCREAPPRCFS